MPRKPPVPKYRLHKARNAACVDIKGKRHYLGPYGSEESKKKYAALISKHEAEQKAEPMPPNEFGAVNVYTLGEKFATWAKGHYVKNGKPTAHQGVVKAALLPLMQMYGETLVADFGPKSLKAIQARLIEEGHSRNWINQLTGVIRRVFKWGVAEEIVPPGVFHALQAVSGLRKGRTAARETAPVSPVDPATVDATLPHLPEVVASMVRFQRLTGCRPGEVCAMRPRDISRDGDVWEYRPESHKTEHHSRGRVIPIGPRAQAILRPYLLRDADEYCFKPAESVQKAGRKPGKRNYRPCYTKDSYRRAIERACEAAFGMPAHLRTIKRKVKGKPRPADAIEAEKCEAREWRQAHCWSPNQLRHLAATEIRKAFGLEAAQVILGHSQANVTQVYAERDAEKGRAVAREIG